MIKIAHVRDLNLMSRLPAPVLKVVEDVVTILDKEYGEGRDVDSDYGGYSLIIENETDLVKLQDHRIDIKTAVFEYVDEICCDNGKIYVSALILLGSDNGIVLIMPLETFALSRWG